MKWSPFALAFGGALLANVSCAQAEISDGVVRIGILNDQSSVYADASGPGSVVAAQMAAEDVGPIEGVKVEIISADHQNKADIGAQIAREWYTNQGVDLIADYANSAVALAVQALTKDLKKASIATSVGSRRVTGDACSPYSIHWTYDSYALANTAATAVTQDGGDKWYFITVDYALGHSLEEDAAEVVKRNGGEVLGASRHPLGNGDFASLLYKAQSAGANVLGLANNGPDAVTTIKQAREFNMPEQGLKIAGLFLNFTDIKPIGLELAQDILIAQSFYWDQDDESREFSKRFKERHGANPTMTQAGVYSAIKHYLEAVKATGSDDAAIVIPKMKETPVNDFFAKGGKIREDGRTLFDMSLYRIKSPAESKYEDDYLELVKTLPGEQVYYPLEKGGCYFVENKS
jgi:branched-chain amino acid transport system substrate-binding protein